MTRIIIRELIWKEWTIEHIKKHSVSKNEAEIAVKNLAIHKRGYKGRYIAVGRSGARILSIIVKREKTGVYLVVTERDADKKERRSLYEKEKSR